MTLTLIIYVSPFFEREVLTDKRINFIVNDDGDLRRYFTLYETVTVVSLSQFNF